MKSNEWYTPARYIEAARQVMGTIDLDPASSQLANETVKATRYFDKEQDGLSQQWHGNVWLNPPFSKISGKSGIGLWSQKLIGTYKSQEINQAIMIAAGQTSSVWFRCLWDYPICFTDHHVHFFCPQLNKKKGQRDCTFFVYLGSNKQKFIEIFSEFGPIVRKVSP